MTSYFEGLWPSLLAALSLHQSYAAKNPTAAVINRMGMTSAANASQSRSRILKKIGRLGFFAAVLGIVESFIALLPAPREPHRHEDDGERAKDDNFKRGNHAKTLARRWFPIKELLLAALLLASSPAFAAATLVQTSDNGTPDHVQWIDYGTSTQSMTFGSNLTNGNSVICGAGAYHSDSGLEFTLPSDASTNTYTERADSGAQAYSRAYVWATHAITGGISSITLNMPGLTGGLYGQATCQEWSGLAASPNDTGCQATLAGTAGDDAEANCTTATLAQAEELVWCLSHMASDFDSNVNYTDPTTGTWTNVFRVQDAATNSAGSADRRTTSATTAVVVQYGHDDLPATTDRWSVACATFKVAATSTWHWRRRR